MSEQAPVEWTPAEIETLRAACGLLRDKITSFYNDYRIALALPSMAVGADKDQLALEEIEKKLIKIKRAIKTAQSDDGEPGTAEPDS